MKKTKTKKYYFLIKSMSSKKKRKKFITRLKFFNFFTTDIL